MKKVCKKCRSFVTGAQCPECGSDQFTETWKGRVVILKPEESVIAQKMNIKKTGTYAIKTR